MWVMMEVGRPESACQCLQDQHILEQVSSVQADKMARVDRMRARRGVTGWRRGQISLGSGQDQEDCFPPCPISPPWQISQPNAAQTFDSYFAAVGSMGLPTTPDPGSR